MSNHLSPTERQQAVEIVSLLSSLIHAWQTNDFHTASLRCDQLQDLGVKVTLPRKQQPTGDTTNAEP